MGKKSKRKKYEGLMIKFSKMATTTKNPAQAIKFGKKSNFYREKYKETFGAF